MKRIVSMLMALAFVVVTTLPASLHAAPHGHAQAESVETVSTQDCHGKSAMHAKTANPVHTHAGDGCCGKDVCQCIGGHCHAAMKIFGNHASAASGNITRSRLAFAPYDPFVAPVFPERMQRPPKA